MTAALLAIVVASGPVELHLDPVVPQTVSFTLHHPLHNVRGVTHEVEGKARAYADGTMEVEVRVALPTFLTGSPAINEDFLELLDAARFPDVTVRAVVPPLAEQLPGTKVDADTTVKIDLHGRTRTFPAAVTIARGLGDHVAVSGHFVVELHDFGLAPPRYLFIDSSPTVVVAFDLAWVKGLIASTALLSGFESGASEGSADGGSSGSAAAIPDAGSADGGSAGVPGPAAGTTVPTSSSWSAGPDAGSSGDGGLSDGGANDSG